MKIRSGPRPGARGRHGSEVASSGVATQADPGRDRVAASLLSEGPATASMLAARLGISATAVRRHLDFLAEAGLVVASDRPPFGQAPVRGRGRPARTFSLTAAGRSQFPSDYAGLASEALSFLGDVGGPAAVAAFAESRAADLERQLRERLGEDWRGAGDVEQVRAFAEALSEAGFATSVEAAPTGVQVCQHHCPVSHVAEEFPQLCEAETEAFARLVGRHVQRLATIAHGDGVCTTVIPLTLEPALPPSAASATTERTSA
ncbi:MAG: helix-turn-helix transcriptional regulator [Actinomycetes bacterium]